MNTSNRDALFSLVKEGKVDLAMTNTNTATYRLVEVKRVKDAIGAYCLDCQQVFSDLVPWHWTKSKWLHENGTESQGKKRKVVLVRVE